MKQLFIHNPIFRIVCPPVYGLVVYLLVLLVFDSVGQITENFFSQEVLLCVVLTYLLSESLRLMIIALPKILPAELTNRARVAVQVLVNMLCSSMVISGGVAVYFYLIIGYTSFRIELITFNSIYLLTSLLYTLLYLSIHSLQMHSKEKLTQEIALRKKMENQLVQLKREVNPDFLYSSLEILLSLVQQDATLAEDFIDRLSAVYRYMLDHRHKELVSLEQELRAMQEMVFIYNHRYKGTIRVHTCMVEEEHGLLLIPGSLPDLMENIILSTILQPAHLLEIDLFIEDTFLVLHYTPNDRLLPIHPIQETLKRLAQTYSFFTDKTIVYQKTEEECIIKLPLLKQQAEKAPVALPISAPLMHSKEE